MLRNWANGLPLIGQSPYSSGLQSVINITLFDSDTPLMRASKQFKRFAATLAGVSAAAAFLSGQALVGTALCEALPFGSPQSCHGIESVFAVKLANPFHRRSVGPRFNGCGHGQFVSRISVDRVLCWAGDWREQ